MNNKKLQNYETEDGFLKNIYDWNEEFAILMSKDIFGKDFELNKKHWEVIFIIRDYYEEYKISPANSAFKAAISKLVEKYGISRVFFLFQDDSFIRELFTDDFAIVCAKIAGIPKPTVK